MLSHSPACTGPCADGDRLRGTTSLIGALLVAIVLAGWSTSSSAAIAASSTFDSGADGWLVKDLTYPNPGAPPNVLGTYTPTFNPTGGNPDGYLSRLDVSDKGWYWYAPAKFLGDKGNSYGSTLSFDLAVTGNGGTTPGFKEEDVILVGAASKTLVFDTSAAFGITQEVTWKSFSVGLTELGWKVDSRMGPTATAADLQAVLGSLSAIYIRGEFLNGLDDVGRLDNFVLSAVPEPSSLAMFAVGIAYLTVKRKRVLANASQTA